MNERSKLNFFEILLLLMLVGYSVSIFNQAGFILAAMLVFFTFISIKKRFFLDRRLLVLFLFSVFYFVNYSLFWTVTYREAIIYLIAPWGSYYLGQHMVLFSKQKNMYRTVLFILVAGFFAHGLLNFYALYISYGLEYVYRVAVDFWRNELISVTTCALYYVPMLGLSFGYLFFGQKVKFKILSAIALVFCLYANVIYENRTAFYLVAILFVIAIFTILTRRQSGPFTWVAVISSFGLVAAAWVGDFFGIKSLVMSLDVFKRLTTESTGRTDMWFRFLQSDWWRHPFGGEFLNELNGGSFYAHNLWLDTIHTVGVVPGLLFIVFTIQSVSIVKNFYRNDRTNRQIYLYLIFAMTINCVVEPIISANPYYFLSLIMMIGAMQGQILKDKSELGE